MGPGGGGAMGPKETIAGSVSSMMSLPYTWSSAPSSCIIWPSSSPFVKFPGWQVYRMEVAGS